MNESTQAPPPPPVSEKKGIPALGWVGIGCGGLLIVAIIAVSLLVGWCKRTVGDLGEFQRNPEKAAAELMVKLNPDLEMVSQDEASGEMTIRTKDGQEMTLSYKDIAEGKLRVKGADGSSVELGNVDLSKVPAWVPQVPEARNTSLPFHQEQDGAVKGMFSAHTPLGTDELEETFKAEASKLGFNSSNRIAQNVNGTETRSLSYSGGGRSLQIIITVAPGEDTLVNMAYEAKP